MVRTQVQLTEEQARALRSVAAEQGVSMAAVIRDLIEQGLRTPDAVRKARALSVAGRFASGSRSVSRDHDRELEQAFSG